MGAQENSGENLLLTEYQYLTNSFWQSEQLGERRVNFFITFTTAVMAGLAALKGRGSSAPFAKVDGILLCSLIALFLFGIVTLFRIIRRNLESHKYLRATGRIRAYFTMRNPAILEYLYFGPYDNQPQRKKEWGKWYEIFSLGTGGLVETVALVNSIIAAVFFAQPVVAQLIAWIFRVIDFKPGVIAEVTRYLLGFAGGIETWRRQMHYVRRRYEEGRPTENDIKCPSGGRD
jgi:hypothetical protein